MDAQALLEFREQKDNFFRRHPHSPLTPEQRSRFSGLAYYDPNPALELEARVRVFQDQAQILMATNREELRPFFRYATFDVTVAGKTAMLTIYRSPDDHYFLPFVDANAGTETYPAGRYLDLEPEGGGVFVIDFNLAYNPYCAYNELFVCPITPKENRVAIPIAAGEKLPEGDWVEQV